MRCSESFTHAEAAQPMIVRGYLFCVAEIPTAVEAELARFTAREGWRIQSVRMHFGMRLHHI